MGRLAVIPALAVLALQQVTMASAVLGDGPFTVSWVEGNGMHPVGHIAFDHQQQTDDALEVWMGEAVGLFKGWNTGRDFIWKIQIDFKCPVTITSAEIQYQNRPGELGFANSEETIVRTNGFCTRGSILEKCKIPLEGTGMSGTRFFWWASPHSTSGSNNLFQKPIISYTSDDPACMRYRNSLTVSSSGEHQLDNLDVLTWNSNAVSQGSAAQLNDINGDGLPDLVQNSITYKGGNFQGSVLTIKMNNGCGWVTEEEFQQNGFCNVYKTEASRKYASCDDPALYDTGDVSRFLESHGLVELVPAFLKLNIDGATLSNLSKDDLLNIVPSVFQCAKIVGKWDILVSSFQRCLGLGA